MEILSEDIAFIISDGLGRWKAAKSFTPTDGSRTALWVISSGPLPLLRKENGSPDIEVDDPWVGWTEEISGADQRVPYFGPGHPGIFWLSLNFSGREPGSRCGLSSLEWIGNRYSIIGSEPSETTSQKWKEIKRQISRTANKVALGGRSVIARPEVYAFPDAFSKVDIGDVNSL